MPQLSFFEDTNFPPMRMGLLLYGLVTPPFTLATYLLTTPGPRRALPALIVLSICAASFAWIFFLEGLLRVLLGQMGTEAPTWRFVLYPIALLLLMLLRPKGTSLFYTGAFKATTPFFLPITPVSRQSSVRTDRT